MDRADWAPSPADVGSVIRSRTYDIDGNHVGTFNTATVPTGDQVMDLIDTVLSEIGGIVGPVVPDEAQDNARRTAAYGTAAEVELGYWPDENTQSNSAYSLLYARYQMMLGNLKKQVSDLNAGDEPNDDMDLMPEGVFPCIDPRDRNAFVGWSSRW